MLEAVSLPKEFLGTGLGSAAAAKLTLCQAQLGAIISSKRTVTPQTQSARTERIPQGKPTRPRLPR